MIGGGQTLGAFLSHGLAQAGYRVAVADLNADNASLVAQQINEEYGTGSACGFSRRTDEQSVIALAAAVDRASARPTCWCTAPASPRRRQLPISRWATSTARCR
ncbi:hypothetical protein AK51_06795 [Serratia nematodiphila DZ0503SBS1]|nr:hypothetical protein AK51_06795 [Serratia nematodiphila DZ0503SBS1]